MNARWMLVLFVVAAGVVCGAGSVAWAEPVDSLSFGRLGECPDVTITIEIFTDAQPNETSWVLTDAEGGTVDQAGPLSAWYQLHTWDICVPATGCYTFTISDSYGDGFEPPGFYSVYVDGELIRTNSNFASQDQVLELGLGCDGPFCGNGVCDGDETPESCPEDCGDCNYCAACFEDTTQDWITHVVFGAIDNTSSQEGMCSYGNYADQFTTVQRGQTHQLRVTFYSEGTWTQHVRAWIDWDGSCTFDADEDYYLGEGVDATLTKWITVPVDAAMDCVRLRVAEEFGTDHNDPCPDLFYGEVEDYTVCVAGVAEGACCLPSSPWCADGVTPTVCSEAGGYFLGANTTCDDLDCNGNTIPDLCEELAYGDFDADSVIDLDDYAALSDAMAGPDVSPSVPSAACLDTYLALFDADMDGDVDLRDVAVFAASFSDWPE